MSFLPPAQIPSPPKIKEDLSPADQVRLLLLAYRGAVWSRWHVHRSAGSVANPEHSKHFDALLKAAKLLLEEGIAPAAWAAFSCDVWGVSGPERLRGKPPSWRWVFAAKRIEKRSGWYRSVGTSYQGGSLIFGRVHKDLIRRYTTMQAALGWEGVSDAEVFERHFPDGLYDRLLEKVRKEAVEKQQRLTAQVRAGEFLW